MLDKELQEQTEKVASKDDFPINWIDRVSLFLSHTIKYLIPVIVLVMMYEIFMRYVVFKPTLWANELSLWMAGFVFILAGFYAMQQRSHIRIFLLYDMLPRNLQRTCDTISTFLILLFAFFLAERPRLFGFRVSRQPPSLKKVSAIKIMQVASA